MREKKLRLEMKNYQEIVIKKSPGLPRKNLSPLFPSISQFFCRNSAFETKIGRNSPEEHKNQQIPRERAKKGGKIKERRREEIYESIVKRLNLIRSVKEGTLSDPTGRERIPRARSINRTMLNISNINKTKATVDDLFPCRPTLPFGGIFLSPILCTINNKKEQIERN